jgi:hypothetical protein
MRPGWPASWPSLAETLRRGYGKLSAVVKTSDSDVELVVLEEPNERVVSGPERVKGVETFNVSVYGGPYEPFWRLILARVEGVRAHSMSVASLEFADGSDSRRSRSCPGALGTWGTESSQ